MHPIPIHFKLVSFRRILPYLLTWFSVSAEAADWRRHQTQRPARRGNFSFTPIHIYACLPAFAAFLHVTLCNWFFLQRLF
jgi:hypothetical protein